MNKLIALFLACIPLIMLSSCTPSVGSAAQDDVTEPAPTEPSRIRTVPTRFYCQYGTDITLEHPSDGIEGWTKNDLPLNLDRTAIVVMHAGYVGEGKDWPSQFSYCEYIDRSYAIAKKTFPGILSAARDAGMKVYHVPFGTGFFEELPGYKRVKALNVTPAPARENTAVPDEVLKELSSFRGNYGKGEEFGAELWEGIVACRKASLNFLPEAMPVGDEAIAENSEELAAIAASEGVNHLIYIGFAIDGCLLTSPGGMVDMTRNGYTCSAIADAVTAIESKESGRTLDHTEAALWRIGSSFGFVYDSDDFIAALKA